MGSFSLGRRRCPKGGQQCRRGTAPAPRSERWLKRPHACLTAILSRGGLGPATGGLSGGGASTVHQPCAFSYFKEDTIIR